MNKKHLEFIESSFIVVGVLFLPGALLRAVPSSFLVGSIRWFITLGALCLLVVRFNALIYKAKRNGYLTAVVVLAIASYSWSDFPDYSFSLVRSQLFPMTVFGLYLGVSFNIKGLVRQLGYGLIAGLLLSWFAAIAIPAIGRAQTGPFIGAWTGVYGHKNLSSSYMTLTALCLLLLSFNRSHHRWAGLYRHLWLRWLGLSAVVFVFLTTSGTGLILSILISISLFLYSKFRWKGKITVLILDLALLVTGAGLFFLLTNWQELVLGIGKDPSLTGRVPMWGVAIQKIIERPLVGYGRGGFWAPGSPYPFEVARAFGGQFIPPHIHNGYIELTLDLGLIGFSLFFVSLVITLARAMRQAYTRSEPEDLFPLGFLILFAVNNMTESYILYLSNLFWPLFIAISLNVGQSNHRAKLQPTDE